MKIPLRYTDIYPEINTTVEELISGLDKKKLIDAIIYLSRDETYKNANIFNFLNLFFAKEKTEFVHEVIKGIKDLDFQYVNSFRVYSELTCLTLLEKVISCDEFNESSKADLEINLFKSLLLINEDLIRGHKSIENLIVTGGRLNHSKILYCSILPTHDIMNYELKFEFFNEAYKAIMLFKFLKKNKKFHSLLSKLLNEYDCQDDNQYLRLMFASVLPEVLNSNNLNKNLNFLKYDRSKDEEDLQFRFMDKIALSESSDIEGIDFISLRSKPLIKLNDSEFLVVSDLFLCQLIHNSLYFKLNNIFNADLSTTNQSYDFRGVYCHEYSEKFLLYNLLTNIYKSKSYKQIPGGRFENMKIDGMTDYYIRNGNKTILIESKNSLFPAKLKYTQDYDTIEKILKRNYLEDTKSKNNDRKAILQLIHSIQMILDGKIDEIDKNISSNPKFYPVIVSHNKHTEIYGFNLILNDWFQTQLNESRKQGYINIRSFPLTVINIDTLIYFQDRFNEKEFDLFSLIEKYHQYVKLGAEDSIRYKDIKEFEKRLMPFSTFVFNYMNEKSKMKPPEIISNLIDELRK